MTEIDWDNLPPTTTPANLGITVKGFTNTEAAEKLAYAVGEIVQTVGSFIDVSTLDGITIAIDYDAALGELDRGIEGLRPLGRSDTAEMQGVAMSPAVLRDGAVKTHIVFNAGPLACLIWEGPEATHQDSSLAIGIIAHECGHVQVTAEKERAIPEARFGAKVEGYEHTVMFQVAEVCWDEYAVCRLSGFLAGDQNTLNAEIVTDSSRVAREQTNEEIRKYRLHANVSQLIWEASGPLLQPIKAVVYLLGGMDYLGTGWDEHPEARTALEEAGYAEFVDDLHAELRRLWDSRAEWTPDLSTFAGLEAIAKRVFTSGGMLFSTNAEGGCRVDVPFTAETMP